jgi:phosphoserine phosphatase
MNAVIILAAPDRPLYREALYQLGDVAAARGAQPPRVLSPWEACEWYVAEADALLIAEVAQVADHLGVDAAVLPEAGRRKKLLIADMDSTIISCECLDELADYAGKKAEISAITERAMRGELDFEGALKERVGMLAGLPLPALERCYQERVTLNAGAEVLVRTMAAHGARCVLVSGGFTFFTSRVAERAGFHAQRANLLIDDGAMLTGNVGEPILGREAKLAALLEEAARMDASADDALAIGDGANDLAMIEAAGLGVAFYAKPIVAAQARAKIIHTSLETALFFQGFARRAFWTPSP